MAQIATAAAADNGHHNAQNDGADEEHKDGVEDDQRKGEQHVGVSVDGGVPPAEPATQATAAATALGGGIY